MREQKVGQELALHTGLGRGLLIDGRNHLSLSWQLMIL